MGKRFSVTTVLAAALFAGVGCTVKQMEEPSLTGPSELALSLGLTATPDTLTLDGSQSSIVVEVHDANGAARSGLPVRLDVLVNGIVQDCGTISGRNVVTGTNGRAIAVYTAPTLPLPLPQCSNFIAGSRITIEATPTGSNFQTSSSRTADIRLMSPGVILPPAGSPTSSFTVGPLPAFEDMTLFFDGSASQPGFGASEISSYSWNFGDGTSGSGRTVTHAYGSDASYSATLTVTNDRGLAASSTQVITVIVAPTVPAPSAGFTFSPTTPLIHDTIVFDASASTAAPGQTITKLAWNFGDSAPIVTCPGDAACTGTRITSHVYTTPGTYVVNLVVTDSAGHTGASNTSVAVGAGNPTAVLTVSKAGGNNINADGGSSTATGSFTIANYRFIWGDGSADTTGTASSASHTYAIAGTYTVTLRVTDSASPPRTSSTSTTVTVP